MFMERCSPYGEDGDGDGIARAMEMAPMAPACRRGAPTATKEGGGPRRAAAPWPSSSLEMVLVWRSYSPSMAAANMEDFRDNA